MGRGTARCGTARRGTARRGAARHGTARRGAARHGTARLSFTSYAVIELLPCLVPDATRKNIVPFGEAADWFKCVRPYTPPSPCPWRKGDCAVN